MTQFLVLNQLVGTNNQRGEQMTTKRDLENQIKHLMGSNSSLVFENKKLKEIVQHYENFIHMTYPNNKKNTFHFPINEETKDD